MTSSIVMHYHAACRLGYRSHGQALGLQTCFSHFFWAFMQHLLEEPPPCPSHACRGRCPPGALLPQCLRMHALEACPCAHGHANAWYPEIQLQDEGPGLHQACLLCCMRRLHG